MRKAIPVILFLFGCLPSDLFAGTRLTFEVSGRPTPIAWSTSNFPLKTTVDGSVTRALPGAMEKIANAGRTWQVAESDARFMAPVAGLSAAGKNGVNSISVNDQLFEESGFLAYTTTWFDDAGNISESDIQIDAQNIDGYDVQALVEHEYGHFLGLDHSGVVGAVMYPYVAKTPLVLDSDDRLTLASIYPAVDLFASRATIRGEVKTSRGAVFGAQVVAVSQNGVAVASTLTDENGSFLLRGLPEGTYRLYAEPLDGPVDREHLSGVWRAVSKTGFVTRFSDPQTVVAKSGASEHHVTLMLDESPSLLNPRWVGVFAANASEVRLASTAAALKPGETAIAIGGDGVVGGVTTFELLAPGAERISDFRYGPNYVYATFRVSRSLPAGSIPVVVRNGSEIATLTGALRIESSTPARPRVRGAR